jgi:Predicted periplasmic solute-binding protein
MISVLSGMLFYYAVVLLWPQFDSKDSAKISIPKGSTLVDVSNQLYDQKIISNKKSFVLAVKALGYEKDIPAGKFYIEDASTNYCLLKKL